MSSNIQTGGTRELWRISFPLMLSCMSMCGMMFVDRFFLANYSLAALNAAVNAGTFAWAFSFGLEHMAQVSQVFVAQYNGAKRYKELGEPVWQLLWFSLLTIPFCIAVGVWGAPLLFEGTSYADIKIDYFRWMLFISPTFCFLASLTGFFIGQGKTRVVTALSLLGNVTNAVLDPLFIFGWEGVVPSMGAKGAAIATGIGAIVQVVVVLFLFLRQENRKRFGAACWRLQSDLFSRCFRLGLPLACFLSFEIAGFGLFYSMMDAVSSEHLLVAGTCQSIILLSMFFGLGLEQGASAVAGNLIGAGRTAEVFHLFRSGIKLIAGFLFLLLTGAYFFGEAGIRWFLSRPAMMENAHEVMALSPEHMESLLMIINGSLFGLMAYVGLEKVRWLINGILRAAGDSRFLMLYGACSVLTFLILPTYLYLFVWKLPLKTAWTIWCFYAFCAGFVALARFFGGKWQKIKIVNSNY